MRFLFVLALLANAAVFGVGLGLFGTSPADTGREPQRLLTQRNEQAVTPGAPQVQLRGPASSAS